MKIKFLNKTIITSLIATAILFSGCSESKSKAEVVKEDTSEDIKVQVKEEPKVVYTKNDEVVNKVFKDIAKIGPQGKYMLIVFGTNTDPYSDRLKADIKNTPELSDMITNKLSAFYLKAHENKRVKLFHEGDYMDVDTKTMISIYGVTSTPTLIFADKKGKAVIVVPGYMPAQQFVETIKFMESKKWEGKDRKNGEVYEALRDHYIANGINVKKKES
ncbi:thioredoxin family protein [Arcobacter sp. YIC-80]|uniref:thioredoxin family protein n=1 Tax=unclassified Arcobacter TaxID=2593671 RepID=UPI003850ECCF